jgi:hypothetical protein
VFLYPAYLWALGALLIPLGIHLWNKRQHKPLAVGSVRWMPASENRRLNRLQFSEFWLWLLRSVFLCVGVLLLAELVRVAPPKVMPQTTWLMVDPTWLAHPEKRQQIEQLLAKDSAELHIFSAGFPQIKLKESPPERWTKATAVADYLSYLREMVATQKPLPRKVRVLVQNDWQYFGGLLSSWPFEVEWLPYPDKQDRVFLERVEKRPPDSLLVSVGFASEKGTSYQKYAVALRKGATSLSLPGGLPTLNIDSNRAYLATAPHQKITMQPPAKEWLIYYAPEFAVDQTYLSAALRALATYASLGVSVRSLPINGGESLPPTASVAWVFWLSEAPLPASFAQAPALRRVTYQAQLGQPLWIRSATDPLHFNLTHRLQPQSLPALWEGAYLVGQLMGLLMDEKDIWHRSQTPLHLSQLQQLSGTPTTSGKTAAAEAPIQSYQSLHWWLWGILMCLFVVERWWNFIRKS